MRRLLLPLLCVILATPAGFSDDKIKAKQFFPGSGEPEAQQRRLTHNIIGRKWMNDPEVDDYLRYVRDALAPEEQYLMSVADIEAVNAFAYLGGVIVLYRGLWLRVAEEDEFIGIVAHEMGHVKLNHYQKTKENTEQITTLSAPLIVAGLLIKDPEVSSALIAGSAGLLTSDLVTYSRELEHEADTFAVQLMLNRGRDAGALSRVFSRFGGGGDEYLSTHPAPDRRAAYLADRLHGIAIAQPPYKADFYLLREKMALRQKTSREFEDSRRRLLDTEGVPPHRKTIARYGLLLFASQKRKKALGEEMTEALRQNPHPYVMRAVAENLLQRKKPMEALTHLRRARQQHPEKAALILQELKTLHRWHRYQEGLQTYDRLPKHLKERPDICLMAGRIASALGDTRRANLILARGQLTDGRFEQALKQITLAEKSKGERNVDITYEIHQIKKRVEKELRWIRNQKG